MTLVETIGRCELCGLTDHHLVLGECAQCRERYGHELPWLTVEPELEPAAPEQLPMGDESDCTHVLTLMGAMGALEPA
jgi:hypothetical protein